MAIQYPSNIFAGYIKENGITENAAKEYVKL